MKFMNQLIHVVAVLALAFAAASTQHASGLGPQASSLRPQSSPASAPLPDVSAFTAQVRARLRTDRALQAQYTFMERREEISVSKLGKVKDGPVKVYRGVPVGGPREPLQAPRFD